MPYCYYYYIILYHILCIICYTLYVIYIYICIYIYIYIYRCRTRCRGSRWAGRPRMCFFDACFCSVRMESPCVVLWRPEALDCRVLIPPEAFNGLLCANRMTGRSIDAWSSERTQDKLTSTRLQISRVEPDANQACMCVCVCIYIYIYVHVCIHIYYIIVYHNIQLYSIVIQLYSYIVM